MASFLGGGCAHSQDGGMEQSHSQDGGIEQSHSQDRGMEQSHSRKGGMEQSGSEAARVHIPWLLSWTLVPLHHCTLGRGGIR